VHRRRLRGSSGRTEGGGRGVGSEGAKRREEKRREEEGEEGDESWEREGTREIERGSEERDGSLRMAGATVRCTRGRRGPRAPTPSSSAAEPEQRTGGW